MSKKEARITPIRSTAFVAQESVAGARIGRIVSSDDQGALIVAIPHSPNRPAKLAVALDAERLRAAIDSQQPAVMVFENGDESRPIIIGLIESLPTITEQAGTPNEGRADSHTDAPTIEADVDGRRVRLTAKDEIVLECGAASITLRRNGRVLIRGTHVESYSDGTNRVKGGQVRIN